MVAVLRTVDHAWTTQGSPPDKSPAGIGAEGFMAGDLIDAPSDHLLRKRPHAFRATAQAADQMPVSACRLAIVAAQEPHVADVFGRTGWIGRTACLGRTGWLASGHALQSCHHLLVVLGQFAND